MHNKRPGHVCLTSTALDGVITSTVYWIQYREEGVSY
jgi:hypothetical protein